jgi:hypothetical protein
VPRTVVSNVAWTAIGAAAPAKQNTASVAQKNLDDTLAALKKKMSESGNL